MTDQKGFPTQDELRTKGWGELRVLNAARQIADLLNELTPEQRAQIIRGLAQKYNVQ